MWGYIYLYFHSTLAAIATPVHTPTSGFAIGDRGSRLAQFFADSVTPDKVSDRVRRTSPIAVRKVPIRESIARLLSIRVRSCRLSREYEHAKQQCHGREPAHTANNLQRRVPHEIQYCQCLVKVARLDGWFSRKDGIKPHCLGVSLFRQKSYPKKKVLCKVALPRKKIAKCTVACRHSCS